MKGCTKKKSFIAKTKGEPLLSEILRKIKLKNLVNIAGVCRLESRRWISLLRSLPAPAGIKHPRLRACASRFWNPGTFAVVVTNQMKVSKPWRPLGPGDLVPNCIEGLKHRWPGPEWGFKNLSVLLLMWLLQLSL